METNYQPLYRRIYNDIRAQIVNGNLKVGDKVPTEFELMDKYSVSRITTARALKELANDGFIQRTRKNGSVVTQCDDTKPITNTDIPVSAPSSSFRHIPLLMPFAPSVGFDILSSVYQEAQRRQYLITLYNSEKQLDKEYEKLQEISKLDIGGLICMPIESYQNLSFYNHFKHKGIPIVFVDRRLPYIDIPYVATDNFHAMYQLTDWLINQGHRQIAFYCYDLNIYNEQLRFRGYIAALEDHGIELNSQYIAELNANKMSDIMLQEGNEQADKLVNEYLGYIMSLPVPPTALVCAFDLLAAYVEKQANLLKISIPNDLSVTGFDNNSICSHLEVPLTSVAQDYDAIGKKAVEIIDMLIAGEKVNAEYLMPSTIVQRASVKCIV